MKNRSLLIFALLALVFFSQNATAQDFGFGSWDEDDSGFVSASSSPVKISGDVSAGLRFFFDEMASADKLKNIQPGNVFNGNLDFSFTGSTADAFVSLGLAPVFDGSSPVSLGEAYGRVFFGSMTLEAGLRKLSWGRADSFGPLDVINPVDYSDLSQLSDPLSIKLPRPMIHAVYNAGSFSRVEAVFVPWFQGHSFATAGRWMPNQIGNLQSSIEQQITNGVTQMVMGGQVPIEAVPDLTSALQSFGASFQDNLDIESYYPQTDILKYAQAGLRFTSTLGSTDFGLQYYFGRLPRPSYNVNVDVNTLVMAMLTNTVPNASTIDIAVDFNAFHQIGVDFASVIAGFNTRAELGVNLTEDMDGTKGDVYNPAIVYSLGFDRELPMAINVNLQGNGSIRLFNDKIKENAFDIEAGKDLSSTRITGIVSRKFLRDELELKVTGLWGIEEKDFLILPAATWSRNDVSVEVSAGFFGGDRKGELGQYRDNGFVRTVLSFSF